MKEQWTEPVTFLPSKKKTCWCLELLIITSIHWFQSLADPGFPSRGRQPQQCCAVLLFAHSRRELHEIEKNWRKCGGVRPYRPHLLKFTNRCNLTCCSRATRCENACLKGGRGTRAFLTARRSMSRLAFSHWFLRPPCSRDVALQTKQINPPSLRK